MSSASLTGDRPRAFAVSRAEASVLLLTLLALALRVTSLSRSLFNDETVSLALAQRSFGHMLGLFGYEANGTPYPLVLWPLIRVFGSSEIVLRLPAVVAGTLSVPALYWAARGFVREQRVALLAALLLAINPMAVWYSQMARSYAFVVLAACVAFGALIRAVATTIGETRTSTGTDQSSTGTDQSSTGETRATTGTDQSSTGETRATTGTDQSMTGTAQTLAGATQPPLLRGAWIAYVAAMALLAYSDLLAAPLLLPAQLLIVWRAGRPGLRRWLCSLAALLGACIPLLIAAVISHGRRNALYWLPKLSRGLVEQALQEFSGGFSGVSAVGWLTLAAGLLLVAVAGWSLRRSPAAKQRDTLAIAGLWGVLPIALLLLISAKQPIFWPRYAIGALPGLCLLGALAARQLMRARPGVLLAGGCLAVVVGVGLYADARQVNAVQQNWRPVAAWLRSTRQAGQPTIVDNVLVLPSLGYYDPAFRAPNGDLVVQEWHDRPLPRGFIGFRDPTGYGGAPDGPPGVALFRRLAQADGGTVWMIFSEVDAQEQGTPAQLPIVSWARSHCRVELRSSVGVQVLRASGCRV